MLRTNKQNFDFALTFIIGIFWMEKKSTWNPKMIFVSVKSLT